MIEVPEARKTALGWSCTVQGDRNRTAAICLVVSSPLPDPAGPAERKQLAHQPWKARTAT